MTISLGDFEAFHRAVHGDRAPFVWQDRLLRQIIERRAWPRVLDLPTGTGKTTCIDIALFAMALDAANPPAERWCPRRIVMVVDRRVVVDQAAVRGRKLLHALTHCQLPIVQAVRQGLAALTGADEEPLAVYTLRGGIPKDDGWARTPDQPLIIATTVDQFGSRLLMQGYGVSPEMRPIHAGLSANDALVLVDEVHLAQPFKQTLERLVRLREKFAANGLPSRFQFSFLSATPGDIAGETFRLAPDEIAPASVLGSRLHTKKPTRVIEVSGRVELARQIATEAQRLLQKHHVIAAIVNRVDTSAEVFTALRKCLAGEIDVCHLTGRMRPLDRDDVLSVYRKRIATDARTHSDEERKLVVVATQCIEAGADFDFDAIVTESASFDGLRQRFGRVDRLGAYQKAEGVIVHDKEAKDDPIYGETIVKTMKWLKSQTKSKAKPLDFGSRSLLGAPSEIFAPKADAPNLLPAYIDLWSQTSPEPSRVAEPELFLHGPRGGPREVQVVWRADIAASTIADARKSSDTRANDAMADDALTNLVAAVSAAPPTSLEAVTLPFIAAQRWLANLPHALEGSGDLDGLAEERIERLPSPGGRYAVRWRGDESDIVGGSDLRPGDTLIIPSSMGGIDLASRCFDPKAIAEVPDVAERALLLARGRPLLRLNRDVLTGLGLEYLGNDPESARSKLAEAVHGLDGWMSPWAAWVAAGKTVSVIPETDDGKGWAVLSAHRVKPEQLRKALDPAGASELAIEDGASATTDPDESSDVGTQVLLKDHCAHVEKKARHFATRLGFSENLVNDLALAGWLHDIGKADPRFQRLLRGGSEIAYFRDGNRILAKSGTPPGAKAERDRARRLSGYSRQARHEVQSLAMLEAARAQIANQAGDLDLVLHLVASHHGFCRPFAPTVDDSDPVAVSLEFPANDGIGPLVFGNVMSANELARVDSGTADRFWSLTAKYGWLELCWLESIVRLADHRASEDEEAGA